jgi:ketosteroid isomerase-like protein
MSQENVEIVRASIAAYNAADIDTQMATYLPTAVAIVHINRETQLPDLGGDRMEGRAEIRRWLLEQVESWRPRYEPSEVRALSHGRVLCRGRWGGVGVATGIELYVDTTVLFSLRDGLIERVEFFDDHSEALKAAGLSE